MSLRLTNTGTAAQLFADFQTVMGTTLGWVLFDDVSPTQKVFTLPADGGQGPAFVELNHDTVGFTVFLRIWQDWDNIGSVGTGDAPNVVDSTTVNGFDFPTAVATQSYRIFGGTRFIAATFNVSAGLVSSAWAGLLTTLAIPALYAVPVGFFASLGNSTAYKAFWRTDAGVGFNNTNINTFLLGNYSTAIESTSGKVPTVSVFAHGTASVEQLPGSADDVLQVPGPMNFDDTITIGANVYRVAGGGTLAYLV